MTKSFAVALVTLSLFAAPAAFAGQKTVTLAVQGMDCASCPIIVKSSLEAVSGVEKVAVSLAEKTAVVTFDDDKAAVPALIAATIKAGYPSAPKS